MEGGNLGVLLPPRRRSPTLDSPFIMKVIDSITVAERASAAAAPEEIEAWDRSRCVQGTRSIPIVTRIWVACSSLTDPLTPGHQPENEYDYPHCSDSFMYSFP